MFFRHLYRLKLLKGSNSFFASVITASERSSLRALR
jgi:hypothetical protein